MSLDRTPFWELLPYIFLSLCIALYLLIRWVLDCMHEIKRRRQMTDCFQRYDSAISNYRPNYRR
jgi:hypothetical protein